MRVMPEVGQCTTAGQRDARGSGRSFPLWREKAKDLVLAALGENECAARGKRGLVDVAEYERKRLQGGGKESCCSQGSVLCEYFRKKGRESRAFTLNRSRPRRFS